MASHPVTARTGHERAQTLDELLVGQGDQLGAVGVWRLQAETDVLVVETFESLVGHWRSGQVATQALQRPTVAGTDGDVGVQLETVGARTARAEGFRRRIANQAAEAMGRPTRVRPEGGAPADGARAALRQGRLVESGGLGWCVVRRGEQSAAGQHPQGTGVNPAYELRDLGVVRAHDPVKGGRTAVGACVEDAIERDRVKVRVEPQVRADALRDGEATPLGPLQAARPASRAVSSAQNAGQHPQQGRAQLGVVRPGETKLEGQGEDPLSNGHVGQYVVHQVSRRLGHVAAGARRAEPATLAGERQCVLVPARRAPNAREAVGTDAAPEEGTDLASHERRQRTPLRDRPVEEGTEVRRHHLVEQRLLRRAGMVRGERRRQAGRVHVPSGRQRAFPVVSRRRAFPVASRGPPSGPAPGETVRSWGLVAHIRRPWPPMRSSRPSD